MTVIDMNCVWTIVYCGLLGFAWCADLTFPPGFKFGAATASYQVEGAWNVSDKGENIWDRFTHTRRHAILDHSDGDIACDSYHKWKEDVQLAKNLGLHFYRLSISWTRLLPSGFANKISEDGIRYYNNLIDELLKNDIEPVVTIYHWDLPQTLQDLGGWANPLIVDWFTDYSKIVFSLFADRVKTWITINEPIVVCDVAYYGIFAPGIQDSVHAPFLCNKHTLLAHAAAYRIYDEEYKPKYKGRVSICNHLVWFMPETDSPKDQQLAELANEHCTGRYSHPIYSAEGGWPPTIEKIMEEKSKSEGYPRSRLPAFTDDEREFVKGTFDFYALNHYTSRIVRKAEEADEIGFWPFFAAPELDVVLFAKPEWKKAATYWFWIYPEGIRGNLNWVKQHYGNVSILITENGIATPADGGLEDHDRVEYYKDYLKQILLAIKEDGVNVEGYTAWTLIDNFEWPDGYTSKFGLHAVDFNDPERKRTPRLSAHFYKRVIENHSLE